MVNQRRAIFLDRDGVINANRPDHVKSWDEFVFLPGALGALASLAGTGFLILVMTNQSAIGRGLASDAAVREIHSRMLATIRAAGGRIDDIYYCPHSPDDNCDCRKPKTGLFLRGAREWNIDVLRSYVVGDAMADIAAARAIGAQAILVLTGRGKEQQPRLVEGGQDGLAIAKDLQDAVDWIRQKEARSS